MKYIEDDISNEKSSTWTGRSNIVKNVLYLKQYADLMQSKPKHPSVLWCQNYKDWEWISGFRGREWGNVMNLV